MHAVIDNQVYTVDDAMLVCMLSQAIDFHSVHNTVQANVYRPACFILNKYDASSKQASTAAAMARHGWGGGE